jgi:hypothetical protein
MHLCDPHLGNTGSKTQNIGSHFLALFEKPEANFQS